MKVASCVVQATRKNKKLEASRSLHLALRCRTSTHQQLSAAVGSPLTRLRFRKALGASASCRAAEQTLDSRHKECAVCPMCAASQLNGALTNWKRANSPKLAEFLKPPCGPLPKSRVRYIMDQDRRVLSTRAPRRAFCSTEAAKYEPHRPASAKIRIKIMPTKSLGLS